MQQLFTKNIVHVQQSQILLLFHSGLYFGVLYIVGYVKRTSVVDIFHIGTGMWYVGTVARVSHGEDGSTLLMIHFPHHESEQLVWEKGMNMYIF